jgi:H+/Cl- antiporter ClcA
MHTGRQTNFNLGRLLESQRGATAVLTWSLVVGALAGLAGGAFRSGISHTQELLAALRALAGSGGPGPLLIPIVSAAVLVGMALIMVRRLAPETAGSGVQEIEGGRISCEGLTSDNTMFCNVASQARAGGLPGRHCRMTWKCSCSKWNSFAKNSSGGMFV